MGPKQKVHLNLSQLLHRAQGCTVTGTKIAEPVGRRATEAIKAHEMQMALYASG